MSFFDEQPRPSDMLIASSQAADAPHPYAWIHKAGWLPIILPEVIVVIFVVRSLYGVWKIKTEERAHLRRQRDKIAN